MGILKSIRDVNYNSYQYKKRIENVRCSIGFVGIVGLELGLGKKHLTCLPVVTICNLH